MFVARKQETVLEAKTRALNAPPYQFLQASKNVYVTPQVSVQWLCIYFMHHVPDLLEKGFFCKYKGYMCNYDFMQGPLYSFI